MPATVKLGQLTSVDRLSRANKNRALHKAPAHNTGVQHFENIVGMHWQLVSIGTTYMLRCTSLVLSQLHFTTKQRKKKNGIPRGNFY